MRRWVGWLLVGICVLLTHRQIPAWSSDLALWEQAARAHPRAVRPAVNLAAQHLLAQRWASARWWGQHARILVRAQGRERERAVVEQILERQDAWIDAFSPSR